MKKILDRVNKIKQKTKMSSTGFIDNAEKDGLLASLLLDKKVSKMLEETIEKLATSKNGLGSGHFAKFDRLMGKMSAYNSFNSIANGNVHNEEIPPRAKLKAYLQESQKLIHNKLNGVER